MEQLASERTCWRTIGACGWSLLLTLGSRACMEGPRCARLPWLRNLPTCLLGAGGVRSLAPRLPRAVLTLGRADMWPLGLCQASCQPLSCPAWGLPFPSGLTVLIGKAVLVLCSNGGSPGPLVPYSLFLSWGFCSSENLCPFAPPLSGILHPGPCSLLFSLFAGLYFSQHKHRDK